MRRLFLFPPIILGFFIAIFASPRRHEPPDQKVPRLLEEFNNLPSGFFDPFYTGRSEKSIRDDWQNLGTDSVPALITALKNRGCPNRYLAADRLAQIGGSKAVEALHDGLHDPDSTVRHWCVRALGTTSDQEAVKAIIPLLQDNEPAVRTAAARALGKLGRKQAVQPLICALDDNDWGTRLETIKALSLIGDARAIEPINNMINKERIGSVRDEGKAAIRSLSDQQ
jgi:HEAT repeats